MADEKMDQSWARVKEQITSIWGEIDEKELKKARGSLPKMVALIAEKSGEERASIMQKISTIV